MPWPSVYDPSFTQRVDDYLKERTDEFYEFWKTRGVKSDSYEERVKVHLPSIEDFAEYLGVSRKILYIWEKEYPDFAEALEKIRTRQHNLIINGSLSGYYNPVISKLILTTNHGYRDRVDATSKDQPLNSFSDDQINRIADRITARKAGNGDTSGEK
jgi:hypothetical protein